MDKAKSAAERAANKGKGKSKKELPAGTYPTESQGQGVDTKKIMRATGLNFGNHRVKIYGSDLTPQAQVLVGGKNYMKDSNGYYVGKKGDWVKVKATDLGTKTLPADVLESLNEGFTAFQKAHIDAQGKASTGVSGSFNDSRWKQTNE